MIDIPNTTFLLAIFNLLILLLIFLFPSAMYLLFGVNLLAIIVIAKQNYDLFGIEAPL